VKHNHVEAFKLMQYADKLGNVEILWNSRDGVTPFGITSRAGREMFHINWQQDRYVPDHIPNVGDRIQQAYRQLAKKFHPDAPGGGNPGQFRVLVAAKELIEKAVQR